MLGFLTVLSYIGNLTLTLLVALAGLIAFALSMLIKKQRQRLILPFMAMSLFVGCSLLALSLFQSTEYEPYFTKTAQIRAVVTEPARYEPEYGRYYCRAKTLSVDGRYMPGKLRLSFSGEYEDINAEDFTVGNVLSFQGRFYPCGGDNEEIRKYFAGERIYAGVNSLKKLTVEKSGTRPAEYLCFFLRDKIGEGLSAFFSGDVAAVLTALITGNKELLSEDIYSCFRHSGVAHLMAVSGMHLTILTLFAGLITEKIRHRGLYRFVMSAVVLFIMLLAGFSASVVRAGIMRFAVIFARSTDKRADSLNSLGLAVTVILLFNPMAVGSVGFLLSVLSTLAIITVSLPLSDSVGTRLGDRLKIKNPRLFSPFSAVIFSLVTSVAVMVFTAPVMASAFAEISLISPLANLLFLPLAPVLIALAAISALLCTTGIMPGFLRGIIETIVNIAIKIAELFGSDDRFVLHIDSSYQELICLMVCLGIISGFFSLKLIFRQKEKSPLTLDNKR